MSCKNESNTCPAFKNIIIKRVFIQPSVYKDNDTYHLREKDMSKQFFFYSILQVGFTK